MLKKYDRTNNLAFFLSDEKQERMLETIRYLIILKTIFQMFILINIWKLKLIQTMKLEKTLNMHNVLILIKSISNKNYNHYYHQVFLEKCSDKLTQ